MWYSTGDIWSFPPFSQHCLTGLLFCLEMHKHSSKMMKFHGIHPEDISSNPGDEFSSIDGRYSLSNLDGAILERVYKGPSTPTSPTFSTSTTRVSSPTSKASAPGSPGMADNAMLKKMTLVLRKMEEVAKNHAERLRFLDPELQSTNTRIEVLETVCRANEDKIDQLSKNNRMLREIIKINDIKEITKDSKLIRESIIHHHGKPGQQNGHYCFPTGQLLNVDYDSNDDRVDGSTVTVRGPQDKQMRVKTIVELQSSSNRESDVQTSGLDSSMDSQEDSEPELDHIPTQDCLSSKYTMVGKTWFDTWNTWQVITEPLKRRQYYLLLAVLGAPWIIMAP